VIRQQIRYPWLRDELRHVLDRDLITKQQWAFLLGEAGVSDADPGQRAVSRRSSVAVCAVTSRDVSQIPADGVAVEVVSGSAICADPCGVADNQVACGPRRDHEAEDPDWQPE
jgi:hypothetical protein